MQWCRPQLSRNGGDWLHRSELNPMSITHDDLDVVSFMQGVAKYLLTVLSIPEIAHRAPYMLQFFRDVFVFEAGTPTAKVKVVKEFMCRHSSLEDLDWPQIFKNEAGAMIVKLMKSSQMTTKSSTKRVQEDKLDGPSKKRTKATKKQKLRCRSRTDPNIDADGCHFEAGARGCKFSSGVGHKCISCGADHTAGACKAAGTWIAAKQAAYANGTL